MLQIDDTIVSFDLFDRYFVCDLVSCKGNCCIEGDAGAPLEKEEIEKIKEILPIIWNDLSENAKKVIDEQGVFYIDPENEPVSSIVNGRECVFAYTDSDGVCKCAIEKAHREGKIDFQKPISCHLYPVRVQKYNNFKAVNYHQWQVCECARKLGSEMKVPIYKFLKEPLIRKFGETWYEQMEVAEKELKKNEESLRR